MGRVGLAAASGMQRVIEAGVAAFATAPRRPVALPGDAAPPPRAAIDSVEDARRVLRDAGHAVVPLRRERWQVDLGEILTGDERIAMARRLA